MPKKTTPHPIQYSRVHETTRAATPQAAPAPRKARLWRRLLTPPPISTSDLASLVSISAGAAVLYSVLLAAPGGAAPAPQSAILPPAFKGAAGQAHKTASDKPRKANGKVATQVAIQSTAADPSPCAAGSVLNVVAHEDDDLLFINPALQQEIDAGMCLRTVYVTAGDDGQPAVYWQQRELGPDAAYAAMAGVPDTWQNSTLTLAGHTLQVHTLTGKPQISLVFLRLPDGNLAGQGFPATGYVSLQKLRDDSIPDLETIDGSGSYTADSLIAELTALMELAQPTVINTQASSPELAGGDHADHQAVGYFTGLAAQAYGGRVPLHRYMGYQLNAKPPNLTPAQTAGKQAAFDTYEQYDGMICTAEGGCGNDPTYTGYLSRQYEQSGP